MADAPTPPLYEPFSEATLATAMRAAIGFLMYHVPVPAEASGRTGTTNSSEEKPLSGNGVGEFLDLAGRLNEHCRLILAVLQKMENNPESPPPVATLREYTVETLRLLEVFIEIIKKMRLAYVLPLD